MTQKNVLLIESGLVKTCYCTYKEEPGGEVLMLIIYSSMLIFVFPEHLSPVVKRFATYFHV